MTAPQPNPRTSGLLLHVTSLPSAYGSGDLGPDAYRFVDFLAASGQSLWQMLPLAPTDPFTGNSPYLSSSAFAGNPLLISPDLLADQGFVPRGTLSALRIQPSTRANFTEAWMRKNAVLEKAFSTFCSTATDRDAYERFCQEQSSWLDDYALFVAIKRANGGAVWNTWPEPLRHRDAKALTQARTEYERQIDKERFIQFLFDTQYRALRDYATRHRVSLFGDLPIYVGYDSADVWANPEIFKLDKKGEPTVVSGVPPDYFSKTGQLWNTPVYNWKQLKKTRYDWWLRRLRVMESRFDIVRIDHFRGLVQYWEVPAGQKTAENGQWQDVPTDDFIGAVRDACPSLKIVAEDLGIITDDVRDAMKRNGFPGMKILLFAFNNEDPQHPYLPHNFTRDCVVYTGTHDNNTAAGWLRGEASEFERRRYQEYTGADPLAQDSVWGMMRVAMMSVAGTVVCPVQDILGLGGEARMNTPSTPSGNWEWRLTGGELTPELAQRLSRMTGLYGRAPSA